MNGKIMTTAVALLVFFMVTSACAISLPNTSPQGTEATQQAFIAQAAQSTATAIAVGTQIAQLQTQLAQVNSGQPTATAATQVAGVTALAPTTAPTATQTLTATLVAPTLTPTFTMVPPTATRVPPTAVPPTFTPTITAMPCNEAHFVGDVTIPDGTTISPGTTFVKTWRLRNDGACAWTTAFNVVYSGGNQLGGPAVQNLPGNVAPGQVIDISLTLVAPAKEGTYRGEWKLRDASGILFGLGKTNVPFYVEIKVAATQSKYPLDFVSSMCQAEWTTGAGTLACPGVDNDARGFVLRVDNPKLETGTVENEPVLVTYPQMITDGIIRGKYPSFRVETGHHFMAILGCAYQVPSCDVNFQLDYQIGTGSIQTLKTWHEVYDNAFNPVDVDLSSLAGKDVKFILTVMANGPSTQDRAQWLAPRIVKK
jgi:hypothetical protein